MSTLCRRFHGAPVMRLIASVPAEPVQEVDQAARTPGHPARRCRSEFIRLALAEKLERDKATEEGAKGRT